ncbi:MAG: phospholipase, partial [Burkholderiaceae bacterium]|nr:phospholipase [Burkholderiaceae bacterium]
SWPYQWADDALRASKLAHAGLAPGKMSEQTNRKGERREVWALALPPDYAQSSAALAKTQLTKSGYRLAALLQAIWP